MTAGVFVTVVREGAPPAEVFAGFLPQASLLVTLLLGEAVRSRRAGRGGVDSADLSGVSGTPTFFINGRRHYGAYDIGTLSAAVQTARKRVAVTPG
jgi:hypothetical protein